MNIPELRTVALCTSEQSHENLHKVYWTHSGGLRNCLLPTEITILMPRMHDRLVSRKSKTFCLSLHVENLVPENFEKKLKKKG